MTDEKEMEYFIYLDALRESGVTNMFGAAPYLEKKFNISHHDAHVILQTRMDTFSARHPV